MQVKIIPVSQFGNQLRVNALKTRRKLNQEKVERLRLRIIKIKQKIQDYCATNHETTAEIEGLEAQIKAATEHAAYGKD